MAVWAGSAQAEGSGGKWTYLNKAGELKTFEGALAEPGFGGEIEAGTVSVLHSKVLGGTSLLYECKGFTVTEGKLKSGGIALGSFKFTECETFLAGLLSKNCNPIGGTVTTNKIKAVMLLHGTEKILSAEPDVGTTFATVHSTEACSIGEEVPIGGKTAFQVLEPTTHQVIHLLSVFEPLMHLYIISDTLEHSAQLLRSMKFFLTGEHQGYKWAGLWN
jgi:hypothetical protein